jgi:hypothetical protein
MADKARESRARRAAQRQGYALRKGRTTDKLALDYGWHILQGRRELAQFPDLAGVEQWLAHPASRNDHRKNRNDHRKKR